MKSPAPARFVGRFGLGARPGDASAIAADPLGWTLAQLSDKPDDRRAFDGRPASDKLLGDVFMFQRELLKARKEKVDDKEMAAKVMDRKDFRDIYLADVEARLTQAVLTETPVQERLVRFWSNHFTVSAEKLVVLTVTGAFEREAIRPHLNGHFRDLLQASTAHPAMILYLDNDRSAGPNSMAGRRRDLGLNENLAREILELQTLGVNGGYTQADVTAFARILTGWTVSRPILGGTGRFVYVDRMHEPGDHAVLGKTYRGEGDAQTRAVLADLAVHPATASFIALKLARHFIADTPPDDVVAALASTFMETDGHLPSVHKRLFELAAPLLDDTRKVRPPEDYVVATLRALKIDPADKTRKIFAVLRDMGQRPMVPPGPDGWPDTASEWLSGQSLMTRIDWASALAERVTRVDSRALAGFLWGDALSESTRTSIARAESGHQALSLLLAAPEMIYA
ncbi:DUF1800 domain-containing protein [Gimibacter soli]|uniref:DUF1800 domain-containing protein n=1 Tax=Gimibacter soli TaxID=3024400 RepID=A0AAF0BLH4_9PROT|nr:DUF1800 domain-containing protein [Gimibacter soli]WCL53161.1 DUF1800 domain-containing protein [Gimibacter soli]